MQPGRPYGRHWDEKFRTRRWGRYPPEDLVRFMGRSFGETDHTMVAVLEIGCGPGPNLWFLHREGFRVSGIDGSPAAVEAAARRLSEENKGLNPIPPDLKVGDIASLPWAPATFDVVVDILALYANTLDVIRAATREVLRVLKPGGRFYTKLWGRNTSGYGLGTELEPGTYDDIPVGPCRGMGVSHFFDREEIARMFSDFDVTAIDVITRTDRTVGDLHIEEYVCQLRKPER